MKKSIIKQFNKFAGKTLKNPDRLTCDVDTTLEEMKSLAQANGLKLRVWFPGTVGTMDFRDDRINVQVKKQKGRLVIKGFDIG